MCKIKINFYQRATAENSPLTQGAGLEGEQGIVFSACWETLMFRSDGHVFAKIASVIASPEESHFSYSQLKPIGFCELRECLFSSTC